jgi:hypothetical protein
MLSVILASVLAMPHVCDYTWSPELDAIIVEEAQRAGTPLDLAYTFIAAESSFNPGQVTPEAAGGYSYGLLQLYDHGQGAGYPPEVLLDPRRNLQIGLPHITAAFRATWSPTIAPFDFIYLISIRSGHPGQVERDDPGILRIARIWSCFFPAAGVFGPEGAPSTSTGMAGGPALAGAIALPFLVTIFPGGLVRSLAMRINVVRRLKAELALFTPGGFQRRLIYRLSPRSITPTGGLLPLPQSMVRLPPRHRPPRR